MIAIFVLCFYFVCMSLTEKYHAVFEPGGCYHIYNCTNNRELLFRSDENYFFFLKKYAFYLSPFVETFAYNLLPNHFHMVVKVRSKEAIVKHVMSIQKGVRLKSETVFLEAPEKYFDELIEAQFHRFFTSYSMAFNKMYGRKGNLFQRAFKRVLVKDDIQMLQTVVYVHANEIKHGISASLTESRFSSYNSHLSNGFTLLNRESVLDLFGGKEAFIKFHQTQTEYYYGAGGLVDD